MSKEIPDDIYNPFGGLKSNDPSIDELQKCQEYYMKLLKNYMPEVTAIESMLRKLRDEQTHFFDETFHQISDKLNKDTGVDEKTRKLWLERLKNNMDKSFDLSYNLINEFTTKKINEFNEAINDKLPDMSKILTKL